MPEKTPLDLASGRTALKNPGTKIYADVESRNPQLYWNSAHIKPAYFSATSARGKGRRTEKRNP
jgi:hypothetical protein